MLIYIIIGMCFGMLIEVLALRNGVEPMTMGQRFFTVLLWPIFLLYFINELLK